ncbi:MAG: primase-helicase zinc-binding domain-containing protein [Dehalococcoidia bacterium]
MSNYYFAGNTYKRNSYNTYCGPCPWSGGKDRFIIEPDTGHWFCRECMNGCTHGRASPNGAYRFGDLQEVDGVERATTTHTVEPPRVYTDYLDVVKRFQGSFDQQTAAYLATRGITVETARKFRLGTYNKRAVVIPMLYTDNGVEKCQAIKRRVFTQYERIGTSKYVTWPGHPAVGIFNRDILHRKPDGPPVVVVANSIFDVMLLDQLGFPCICSFAGEASWLPQWAHEIQATTIINLEDWDEIDAHTGQRPGSVYALSRAYKLRNAPNVERVITTRPPDDSTDVTAMWQAGHDVTAWLNVLICSGSVV